MFLFLYGLLPDEEFIAIVRRREDAIASVACEAHAAEHGVLPAAGEEQAQVAALLAPRRPYLLEGEDVNQGVLARGHEEGQGGVSV